MSRTAQAARDQLNSIRNELGSVYGYHADFQALLERVGVDLKEWLPHLVEVAGEYGTRPAAVALRMLAGLVDGAKGFEQLLQIHDALPSRTITLAPVSLKVTERMLECLPEAEQLEGGLAAVLLSNLSVRCRQAHQPRRALLLAEKALRIARSLKTTTRQAQRIRATCLMTAAAERAEHGNCQSSLEAANEACSVAARLSRTGQPRDRLRGAQAEILRAHQLARRGQFREAISTATMAKEIVVRLPKGQEADHGLATVEATLAYCHNQLGEFQHGVRYGDQADKRLRVLAGGNPEQYLDQQAIAANSYALGLDVFDPERAARILGGTVARLQMLKDWQPDRFGRLLAGYLVRQATALARVGQHSHAIRVGRSALRQARKVGHRSRQRDWHLEFLASENLLNLYAVSGEPRRAIRAGREALHCHRHLPLSPPDAVLERARTLRTLAQVQTTLGNSHATKEALTSARQALRVLKRATAQADEPGARLRAECSTLVAACLEHEGRIGEAIRHVKICLGLWRELLDRDPLIYDVGLACSTYHLARLLLKAGDAAGALSLGTKAVVQYEAAIPKGSRRSAAFVAACRQVVGEAEVLLGRLNEATRVVPEACGAMFCNLSSTADG